MIYLCVVLVSFVVGFIFGCVFDDYNWIRYSEYTHPKFCNKQFYFIKKEADFLNNYVRKETIKNEKMSSDNTNRDL